MTVEQMITEMKNNSNKIGEIIAELNIKNPEKKEHVLRALKHYSRWVKVLNTQVIRNKRKAEIQILLNESNAALRQAKRIKKGA